METVKLAALIVASCASLAATPIISSSSSFGCIDPGSGITISGAETIMTADAEYAWMQYPSGYNSTCTVTETETLVTAGSGPGFLQFSLFGSTEASEGLASTGFFVDNVKYGSCGENFCTQPGVIPIDVGTPLTVTVTASGHLFGDSVGAGTIQVTLQAYEGDPVYVDIGLTQVPEPGTWVFLLSGLLALRKVRRG